MGNIEKFNSMASRYDTEERALISKMLSNEIRRHVVQGKSAIDFGCGTGLIGIDLLDVFSSVLFIDASQNMIEIVDHKIDKIDNATALCCDIESEQLPDIKADYILVVQTLLHIKDTEAILSKLQSLLNAGGHLIVVDFDRTYGIETTDIHHGFDQKELIDSALNSGFSKASAHTFYQGKSVFAGKDATMFLLDAER